MELCDAHFHLWDTVTHPNVNLGAIADSIPSYQAQDYAKDVSGLNLRSAVHIEAVVGQCEEGHALDPLAETKMVVEQLSQLSPQIDIHLVPYVNLSRPDAEEVIQRHRAIAGQKVVGFRMILNFSKTDPSLCWPQVGSVEYLDGTNAQFKESFSLFERHNLSFELQVNWFQLSQAATFLKNYLNTVVILDHMGCLKLGENSKENEKRIEVWRQGMKELSLLPNVYIKVSMLDYVKPNWPHDPDSREFIAKLVNEVLTLFGPTRLIFASNFPVDKHTMALESMVDLYKSIFELIKHLSTEDQQAVLCTNARRVYKFDSSSNSYDSSSSS